MQSLPLSPIDAARAELLMTHDRPTFARTVTDFGSDYCARCGVTAPLDPYTRRCDACTIAWEQARYATVPVRRVVAERSP